MVTDVRVPFDSRPYFHPTAHDVCDLNANTGRSSKIPNVVLVRLPACNQLSAESTTLPSSHEHTCWDINMCVCTGQVSLLPTNDILPYMEVPDGASPVLFLIQISYRCRSSVPSETKNGRKKQMHSAICIATEFLLWLHGTTSIQTNLAFSRTSFPVSRRPGSTCPCCIVVRIWFICLNSRLLLERHGDVFGHTWAISGHICFT
ncbi:hypothetical protein EDD16DRAFT_268182 [Pisolithus croceorrhizus]|nr:hypothetical protein EDD16DRAFT_268182 [Pisolithus croceorrhizus]